MSAPAQTRQKNPDNQARGRLGGAPRGELHGNAKMTEQTVREMRAWYGDGNVINMVDLAAEYGISYATCRAIIRRQTWKHVTDEPVKRCPHCCGSGKIPA